MMEALLEARIGLTEDERQYELEGEVYDRVTTVIDKALSPFLLVWGENTGIQSAHAVYKQMNNTLPSSWEDTRDMAHDMGIDCEGQKLAGGSRGADVHLANQVWIQQGTPPNMSDFEPESRPYAQTYCQFLIDYEPEFECSEVTVWNPDLKVAGTFDAIGRATKQPKGARHPNIIGKRLVWDYKTNKHKRIYFPQHHFQLAAYRDGLDYHGIEVDGEAVVAIGPSPWHNSGKPYSVGVNYVPARLWPAVVASYRAIEEARKLNPNSRR